MILMKTKIILRLICTLALISSYSCGTIFREVNCRDFEFQDELKWFPGNVGDALTLTNDINETKEFIIKNKYILHRTKYISDTGCNCHDRWGILLSVGNDTISMYGDSQYIEKNSADRYDYFFIKHNDKLSGFITEDKSVVANYSVDDITFAEVMIFEYSHTESNMFNKIVIAPEIGVVELTETNGNIWRNLDLETKLNIDISSFDYSENTCE